MQIATDSRVEKVQDDYVMAQFVIPRSVSDEESCKIPRCARNDRIQNSGDLFRRPGADVAARLGQRDDLLVGVAPEFVFHRAGIEVAVA